MLSTCLLPDVLQLEGCLPCQGTFIWIWQLWHSTLLWHAVCTNMVKTVALAFNTNTCLTQLVIRVDSEKWALPSSVLYWNDLTLHSPNACNWILQYRARFRLKSLRQYESNPQTWDLFCFPIVATLSSNAHQNYSVEAMLQSLLCCRHWSSNAAVPFVELVHTQDIPVEPKSTPLTQPVPAAEHNRPCVELSKQCGCSKLS